MQKSVPVFVWRLAICVAAALPGFIPPARGADPKREVLVEAPPPAVPLAVKVKRGEPIDIPLRIYGRKNEPLKYLIRVPPEHGKLSTVRSVDRETGSVAYTPPADLAVTRDKFSYAVQSSAGVSAAVEVSISIVDSPPRLAIPDALVFPAILAGGSAVKPLEITNRGGSIAEGEIAVDAPWRIEGASKYRLGAGEHAFFKIVFAPADGGKFDGAVRYTSQPEQSTPVQGEAKAPISADPAKLVLQTVPGEAVRAGVFELSNATDAPRKMRLIGGERLRLPVDVLVPAQGKASVQVQTAAGDAAAFEAEVRAEAPGLVVRVGVQAPRLGPVVRVSPPRVDFGRIDATKTAAAEIDVENIGGSPATIACEIGAPFSAEPLTGAAMPGEKKAFTIRALAGSAGAVRAILKITTEPQTFEIPVEADFLAKTMPASAGQRAAVVAVGAAVATGAGTESAQDQPPVGDPVAGTPPEWIADLRPAPGANIDRVGTTSAEFSWPASLSPATRFRIEEMDIVTDESGEPKPRWVEIPAVKVRRNGEGWRASMEGLRPGGSYRVRAVPVSTSGEAGGALFQVQVVTLESAAVIPKITAMRGLLAALAGWLAFLAWQRFRARRGSGRGA